MRKRRQLILRWTVRHLPPLQSDFVQLPTPHPLQPAQRPQQTISERNFLSLSVIVIGFFPWFVYKVCVYHHIDHINSIMNTQQNVQNKYEQVMLHHFRPTGSWKTVMFGGYPLTIRISLRSCWFLNLKHPHRWPRCIRNGHLGCNNSWSMLLAQWRVGRQLWKFDAIGWNLWRCHEVRRCISLSLSVSIFIHKPPSGNSFGHLDIMCVGSSRSFN